MCLWHYLDLGLGSEYRRFLLTLNALMMGDHQRVSKTPFSRLVVPCFRLPVFTAPSPPELASVVVASSACMRVGLPRRFGKPGAAIGNDLMSFRKNVILSACQWSGS